MALERTLLRGPNNQIKLQWGRLKWTHAVLIVMCIITHSRTAVTEVSSFDPDALCKLVTNGTKLKDPQACNAWFECVNGVPYPGKCTDKLFFDRNSGNCVDANTIRCISSDPCAPANGATSFEADPTSCTHYYYCSGASQSRGECDANFTFNIEIRACVRNYPCKIIDPNSLCNVIPDNVYFRKEPACNEWSMCFKGNIVNGTCPGTFYFNPQNGFCDYPEEVDCQPPPTPPPTVPASNCGKPYDFISDESTCDGYYYCNLKPHNDSEYDLIRGSCPSMRFFQSKDGGECVARTSIPCNYDRCAGFGYEKIQLANANSDNCKSYLICQNGETIGGSYLCPEDQYFDELQQRCTTEVVSYPACVSSPPIARRLQ